MSPREVQRIKDKATELFKEKQFTAYEAELQVTLCVISAFVEIYEQETGCKINFTPIERQPYQSVDEE